MSTRSFIAIEDQETGAVRAMYCHMDGYPEGVGQMLLDHYRESTQVEALIALGYASSLDETVAATLDCTVEHNRGEPPNDYDNADVLFSDASEDWIEWCYLYRQGVWFVTKVGGGAGAGLCDASDPDGAVPANWRNLEGVLTFVEPVRPSYAFDVRQLPTLGGKTLPVIVAQLPLI